MPNAMPWKTDLERHRVRRTLSLVKRKLEEALRLSRLLNESDHAEQTTPNRHR